MSKEKKEKTLADEIAIVAKHEISQLPTNSLCTVINNYSNANYVDIECKGRVYQYVQVIGPNTIGVNGLLTFTENDFNNPVVITGGENTTDIEQDMMR